MKTLKKNPVVKTGMLIRRPVAEVFEAFADPAVTTRFWFTHGSGRLEAGETVEWTFQEREEGGARTTFVHIENQGFHGDGEGADSIVAEAIVAEAIDSAQGFSFVLAAAKAYLEHGIRLNLVADHDPDHHVDP